MIGIYKITSPVGKIYIGQSVNIQSRFKQYKRIDSKTKSQTKLYRSLIKYGSENHKFEIIEECIFEQLTEREGFWQDNFNSINNGLNCRRVSTFDKTGYCSQETKDRLRQANIGKTVLPHNIENTRNRMLGNTYNSGRKRSQTEKDNISNTMKLLKINVGDKNPMFNRKGEDNHTSKVIVDLQTGVFYFGIREAAYSKNISYSSLKKYMCGERTNKTSFIYC
jgi:group I intron endonuclease